MKRTLPKRSNLFLMEMIIAILFFALASAVCVQFFAKSKLLSLQITAQNHAIITAKSAAAFFENSDGSLEHLQSNFQNSQITDDRLIVYYNNDWKICSKKSASYQMQITIKKKNSRLNMGIFTILDSDKNELFELTASCYQPIKVEDS